MPDFNLPEWLKGVFAVSGWVAVIAAVLKYRSEARGHEVAAVHNADLHDEKTREQDRRRIEVLEDKWGELQEKYLSVKEQHIQCEAKIAELKLRVESLTDGLALSESRHLIRERELQDMNRDLRGVNQDLLHELERNDMEARIADNARKIEEVNAPSPVAGLDHITVHAEAVNVNATPDTGEGGTDR